jgi:hypothetical protein
LSLDANANICISVRNPLSDYEVREKVAFSINETVEKEENSREPECHFVLKWEGAAKRSTLIVLDGTATKAALKKKKKFKDEFSYLSYTADHNGNYVPVLAFECRGMEPYAFHCLGDEFVVESEGGIRFESDVDLSDGDWGEYDEENDAAVSISDFETKIEAV